jgi:hypothetical protein
VESLFIFKTPSRDFFQLANPKEASGNVACAAKLVAVGGWIIVVLSFSVALPNALHSNQ